MNNSSLNINSVISTKLSEEFIDTISGNLNKEYFNYDDLRNIMIGILSPQSNDSNLSSEDIRTELRDDDKYKSIPSVGLNFKIKKSLKTPLYITIGGNLFYRTRVTYDEEVEFVLNELSKTYNESFEKIEEWVEYFSNLKKSNVPFDDKISIMKKFRLIRLEYVLGDIELNPQDLKDGESIRITDKIDEKLKKVIEVNSTDSIRNTDTKFQLRDLLNKQEFEEKLRSVYEVHTPKWNFELYIKARTQDTEFWYVTVTLVNRTTKNDINGSYDQNLYNARINIKSSSYDDFQDIKLNLVNIGYKRNKPNKALAINSAYDDDVLNSSIFTTNIPIYMQKRLKTKSHLDKFISFENLVKSPISNLEKIGRELEKDYSRLYDIYLENICKPEFSEERILKRYHSDMKNYRYEINRFKKGIDFIKRYDYVGKAFSLMNKTFSSTTNETQKKYDGWRLFQIVFIVSLLGDIIKNEYIDSGDQDIEKVDLSSADLLYFPTGGGKTEAFLGCVIFGLFFDRLRGKNFGVSSIIKYPLRLLSVQQLERTLVLLTKANNLLKIEKIESNFQPFSLGYYVGDNNTPNTINESGKNSILSSSQIDNDMTYRIVDHCPLCGQKSVHVEFNTKKWSLEHICYNSSCEMGVIPLYIIDNEIYRFLPSVIISTIDKLANFGQSKHFKNLFGMVSHYCEDHGFSSSDKCDVPKCNSSLVLCNEDLKDPVPTLIIQDELHLVRESLGTFASHYETLLQSYTEELINEKHRKKLKYIGATATINNFESHIFNLYCKSSIRFPTVYPSTSSNEDFYSYIDESDISRIIVGYSPYNYSVTDAIQESNTIFRKILHKHLLESEKYSLELHKNNMNISAADYQSAILNYWISINYTNSKDDSVELSNIFQNQGNNSLKRLRIPEYNISHINGDVPFQEIREILSEIESTTDIRTTKNLLISTSTISHGVDEDVFNQIYFYGIPNNTAEYVQAYSRVGRKYPGIVIDLIRLRRERDKSYLKNFMLFHENKDILIDPVPINRWAKNAIYATFPGIFMGILKQYFEPKLNIGSMHYLSTFKKAVKNGDILVNNMIDLMIRAYKCQEDERSSQFYKEIISEEIIAIFDGLEKDASFLSTAHTQDLLYKYCHGHKYPMTSLRDIEKGLLIRVI